MIKYFCDICHKEMSKCDVEHMTIRPLVKDYVEWRKFELDLCSGCRINLFKYLTKGENHG